MTLSHDEQIAVVNASLEICDLLESLIGAVRRGVVTPDHLAMSERALRPMKAGLLWFRDGLQEPKPDRFH